MSENQNAVEFKKINIRLDRIEQILPTLATKDDIKGMPTQDDPKGFLTKEDLKVIPTVDDPKGFAMTAQLKAESQETRRFMMVLHEDLKADIRVLAEGLADMNRALVGHDHPDIRADINRIDLRVLTLETKKKRRPRAS
jgi:hypothetical protein